MNRFTKEIIVKASQRKLEDVDGYSLNWYVYDTYGQEFGFQSTDMLSVGVQDELKSLDLFDWRK